MARGGKTRIAFIRYRKIVDGPMTAAAEAIIGKTATDIADSAAVAAPYEYGVLSASVEAARVGALQWRANVGAYYGLFQEYGTRYVRAQPFLIPATRYHARAFELGMRKVFT